MSFCRTVFRLLVSMRWSLLHMRMNKRFDVIAELPWHSGWCVQIEIIVIALPCGALLTVLYVMLYSHTVWLCFMTLYPNITVLWQSAAFCWWVISWNICAKKYSTLHHFVSEKWVKILTYLAIFIIMQKSPFSVESIFWPYQTC